jgi:plasmid stabilization system protein ParE
MSIYALTPLAKSDIFEIRSYIAVDNVDVADRVERALFDACEFLAESSLRCHFRRDITPLPLRFWTLTPLSELQRRLPARDGSLTGGGCPAWKEKYPTDSD